MWRSGGTGRGGSFHVDQGATVTRVSTRDVPAQIGDLPRIGRPANSALLQVGITTLEQVAALGRTRLAALHGVGPKAITLLAEAIRERGLEFAP